MSAFDLHPALPDKQYITELTHAYELHQAAGACTLMRNRTQGLDPLVLAQRKQLLDILITMIINERDKALDAFATAWIKYRAS